MWYGNMFRFRRTILWHVVHETFFSDDKRRSDFRELNHSLPNVFLPVPVTHSSACVSQSQTIFQEHAVPFHTVPMWRNVVTIVLASKSSLGPYTTRKFRIPYDALCSLLRCDRHVCLSCASVAKRLNRLHSPYTDILPAHIQTNCSELCTLTSSIQRFTFLTSQMDHSVF
jgi:hypothetical protein